MVKAPLHILCSIILSVGLLTTFSVSAQSWIPGFNYRKSITLNKAQVSGVASLIDFPVLISLTDPDLKYLTGQCNGNKISSASGLDISFVAASSPGSLLKFQIDTYDPVTGSLNCWVNIPILSAGGGTAPSNVIYLYYGSNMLQDPFGLNAVSTWTSVPRLWHLNLDATPAASMNAASNMPAQMAKGTGVMNGGNFTSGKIGTALRINGSNESMNAVGDTSTIFTISAWIKVNRIDLEQVLISNDSTGIGGYTIKINSSGKIALDIRKGTGTLVVNLIAGTALLANQWYHIAVLRDGRAKSIYINGKIASAITRNEGVGAGGRLSIGRGKQNDRYFGGMIDELRIFNQVKTADWLKTDYNNQNDPAAFYVVGNEEKNPVLTETGYLFTGALNDSWSEPANWNGGRVPEPYANATVKAFSKVTMRDAPETRLNQLTLENGASLTVQNMQLVVCKTQVNENASLLVSESLGVQFNGDVLNNGLISTSETAGRVTFSGTQGSTDVSGSGSMRVFHLQINQNGAANQVVLNQVVVVTGKLELKVGILNCNGKLTLTATKTQVASILPISSLNSAKVIGDVIVEQYVAGSFPLPATARGWRLWSSPVYASLLTGSPDYELNSFKRALFVTGKGGAINGFDDSPQNGNTIFTHDQSVVGSLSQKYIAIPNLAVHVPMGTGIYVYSRGFRESPDAFTNQVLSPPFINPEAYIIRYIGKLFSGDLRVLVNSRNRKEQGDGFNLLGNPYASPIRAGSLVKENTTAFVWMFNPLNNTYDVSDDPEYIIPAGAGFFIKVAEGASIGSVTFSEQAKVSGLKAPFSSALSFLKQSTMATSSPIPATLNRKLEVVISRSAFSQKYILKLEPTGSDEITDEDAVSLGEGYVNIGGLSADKQKLMVDSRGFIDREAVVPLYVKGWSSGAYDLDFTGFESFQPQDSVELIDKYLNSSNLITLANHHYTFQIDADATQSQGSDRFSLRIKVAMQLQDPSGTLTSEAKQIHIYPNPFIDVITLTRRVAFPESLQVIIRDLMGKPVFTRDINTVEGASSLSLNAGGLSSGLYVMELRDRKLNKRLKTAKIIKL
jgi:hypothetical protein